MHKIKPFSVILALIVASMQAAISYFALELIEMLLQKNLSNWLVIGFWILLIVPFYSILVRVFKTPLGKLTPHSKEDYLWGIHAFYWVCAIEPFFLAHIPVPIFDVFYRCLGAKIKKGTYGSGIIFDPQFVTIGSQTTIGKNTLIVPHQIEGPDLIFSNIQIGHRVVIGMNSCILPGCSIEDGAIIGAGSVLAKNTHVGENEIWAGNPAIKKGIKDFI